MMNAGIYRIKSIFKRDSGDANFFQIVLINGLWPKYKIRN